MLRHPVCLYIFSSDSADDASLKVKQSVDMTKKNQKSSLPHKLPFSYKYTWDEFKSSISILVYFRQENLQKSEKKQSSVNFTIFFKIKVLISRYLIFSLLSPPCKLVGAPCMYSIVILSHRKSASLNSLSVLNCVNYLLIIVFFFVGVNLCLIF